MDRIDIFDIASVYGGGNGVWYTQQATGNIPPPRVDFCAVGAAAPDNSSHNMWDAPTNGKVQLYWTIETDTSMEDVRQIQPYSMISTYCHYLHFTGRRYSTFNLTHCNTQNWRSARCTKESSSYQDMDIPVTLLADVKCWPLGAYPMLLWAPATGKIKEWLFGICQRHNGEAYSTSTPRTTQFHLW
jgi:hypothetical protein